MLRALNAHAIMSQGGSGRQRAFITVGCVIGNGWSEGLAAIVTRGFIHFVIPNRSWEGEAFIATTAIPLGLVLLRRRAAR